MAKRTLYGMFQETVAKYGDAKAVGFRASKNSEFTYWTYKELGARVRAFALGLDALGLKRGDRFAIISHDNRVEWAIADLASQLLGLITVPIYGTLPVAQVAFYIRDCGARSVLVSDSKQLVKAIAVRTENPALEFIISMEGDTAALAAQQILSMSDVAKMSERTDHATDYLVGLAAAVSPDDTATLIYTSGTTGEPKGAMLTHRNLLQTPDAVLAEPIAEVGPGDIFLSFLPLSHITERVGGHYLPLRAGACIVYSLGLMALADEIQTTVRPTVMLSVPRLWENAHDKALDRLAKEPPKRRKAADWAIRVGIECARRRSARRPIGPLLGIQRAIADRLVLSKLRDRITGGRLRFCVSGGAPLHPSTAEFFLGIGAQILEGYGLSETSIMCINRPGRQRIGTVGTLLQNVEVKLAADGESLMRGEGRMQGYYNRPEATAEALDAEGWFHTGDIGELSADGYLKITDRKKDILVLSNGKKVAPQPVEALIKHSAYIAEAVLFGDRQPTVVALLVPAFDRLIAWAKENKFAHDDVADLLVRAEVQKLYKSEIDRTTPDLADYEKVRAFRLVSKPFSIDGGELTPTLKVKRKVVAEKYADLLATMSRG